MEAGHGSARRRRRAGWVGALALAPLLGCGDSPAPQPEGPGREEGRREPVEPTPDPEFVAPGEEESAAPRLSLALRELLPLRPAEVQWFRERPGGGRLALRTVTLRDGQRERQVMIALAPESSPFSGLRLWRGQDALWLELGPWGAYRALASQPSWDRGLGRSLGPEGLETPLGRLLTVHTVRDEGPRSAEQWFANQRGLIRLEVYDNAPPRRRRVLFLEDTVALGPAPEYPAVTPKAAWSSLQEALRRLDLAGLDLLCSASLRRRLEGPSLDESLSDLDPPATLSANLGRSSADHLTRTVGELLRIDPQPTGAWEIEGEQARAPCRVLSDPGEWKLVLERGDDERWRWSDLIR